MNTRSVVTSSGVAPPSSDVRTDNPPSWPPAPTGIISFTPAQPCSALVVIQRRCKQPATVGLYWANSDGTITIQPLCKSCATATAALYPTRPEELQ